MRKLLLLLLLLPSVLFGQTNVQRYQADSVFTYNNDSNYVSITPVTFQRGDTSKANTIVITQVTDYGTTAAVNFTIGNYPLSLSISGSDYQGYVLYDWKYLFWRIADYYSLEIL
jgi:hypothetical protein